GVMSTHQSSAYKSDTSPVMTSTTPQSGYLSSASTSVNIENGVNATTLLSAWGDSVAVVKQLVNLPALLVQDELAASVPMPGNAQLSDVQDLIALYQVLAVSEIAAITVQVLSDP
ncbi:hypothetical protein ACNQ0T_23405, partial [Enterobacter cloacae complex sp.6700776]